MAGVTVAVSTYEAARSESQRDGSWLRALESEGDHFILFQKHRLSVLMEKIGCQKFGLKGSSFSWGLC